MPWSSTQHSKAIFCINPAYMQVLCSIKENIYSFIAPDYAKQKSIPSTRIMILLTKQINEQETTYRMTPAFLRNKRPQYMGKSRKNKARKIKIQTMNFFFFATFCPAQETLTASTFILI